MTDHQLAILGILIGTYALWRSFYAEAKIKIRHLPATISMLASILVVTAFAYIAAHA